MFVLAINGSPNEDGNTAFLLDTILTKISEAGIDTQRINLHKIVTSLKNPFCSACADCKGACYKGTALEETFELMKKADVIIFGSPVYFGGATAQMKVLFDKSRAYRKDRAFVGKFAAAVSVGGSKYGGQEATVRSLHDVLLVQGMTLVGDGAFSMDAGHHGVCAHRPAREDEFALKRCEVLAQRIIDINS